MATLQSTRSRTPDDAQVVVPAALRPDPWWRSDSSFTVAVAGLVAFVLSLLGALAWPV